MDQSCSVVDKFGTLVQKVNVICRRSCKSPKGCQEKPRGPQRIAKGKQDHPKGRQRDPILVPSQIGPVDHKTGSC